MAPSVLFPESRTSVPQDSCCTAGPPWADPGASQGTQLACLANWVLLAVCVGSGPCPLVRFSFNFGPQLGHPTSLCVCLIVSELCPNPFGLVRSHVSHKRRSFRPCGLFSSLPRLLRLLSFLSLPRSLCSLAALLALLACWLPLLLLLSAPSPSARLLRPARSLSLSLSLSFSLPFARSRRLAREGTTDHRCARVRYGSRKREGN